MEISYSKIQLNIRLKLQQFHHIIMSRNDKPNKTVVAITDKIESTFNEQNHRIEELKQDQIQKLEEIRDDIKKISRQDYTLKTEFEGNTLEAKKLNAQLQSTQSLIQDSLNVQLDEIKDLLHESIKFRQRINEENSKFDTEITKWQDFSVQFLDTMERTLEQLKNAPSISEIERVVKIFSRDVGSLGIERIIPCNESFSYDFHEHVGEEESEDVKQGDVIKCIKWGYKINGKLYKNKRAKVITAKSPIPVENSE